LSDEFNPLLIQRWHDPLSIGPGTFIVKSRRQPNAQLDLNRSLSTLIAANERLQMDVTNLLPNGGADESPWIRAMIDQVPDYLFVKDKECRFVVANKAVAADLGHGDPAALIGRTDLELHPKDLAQRFYDKDRLVMATGLPSLDQEEFVILQSGEKRWLSTSKLPLRGPDGEIIGLVGLSRDVTARKLAEEQVRFLAFNDPLTGLSNRASFAQQLTELIASKRAPNGALLYIDLDRFKYINDTFGHAAGDTLLIEVGKRLRRIAPPSASVARLGGDEFAWSEDTFSHSRSNQLRRRNGHCWCQRGNSASWRCRGRAGIEGRRYRFV
jgi:PAS domain S-box-containing protein